MLKYNWIEVPESISPLKLIAWFDNPLEMDKLEKYIDNMNETYDLEYTFPPILGYPIIIDKWDVWKEMITDINWETQGFVDTNNIWQLFFVVTDWFHRSTAAITTWKKYIDIELDRESITNQEELKVFDKYYQWI